MTSSVSLWDKHNKEPYLVGAFRFNLYGYTVLWCVCSRGTRGQTRARFQKIFGVDRLHEPASPASIEP
jgi:hypothetical protein